jgi:hypothetical protein
MFFQLHSMDVATDNFGSKTLRLLPHCVHQIRSHDAVCKSRIVFDQRRQRELPAGLLPFNEKRLKISARGVDGRR